MSKLKKYVNKYFFFHFFIYVRARFFFQVKYEGTKEKLMEMINFKFSFKITKYPAG